LNADNDTVTISEFSSGAFATATMHVIYSNRIKGVGIKFWGLFLYGAVSAAYFENLG